MAPQSRFEIRTLQVILAASVVPAVLAAEQGTIAVSSASSSLGLPEVDSKYFVIFENVLAFLTAAFVINFFLGYRENKGFSNQVVASMLPIVEEEFSHVGVDEAGTRLMKDGFCDSFFYASGRRYTTGMTAALELRNRQDFLATISRMFQSSMADRCTLTLPLRSDYAMEPVSFLLVKPKELERLRKAFELRATACVRAVEEMAGEVRIVRNMPGGFTVLADHDGVVSSVLTGSVRELIAPIAKYVHFVQMTDCGKGWDLYAEAAGPRYVRIVFDLPATNQAELDSVVQSMIKLAVMLVDMSANLSLSKAARARAMDLRNRIAAEKEKERLQLVRERHEEKKMVKRKAEAEAAEKRLAGDPVKQAKAMEKQRKKEVKQRMKKATRK